MVIITTSNNTNNIKKYSNKSYNYTAAKSDQKHEAKNKDLIGKANEKKPYMFDTHCKHKTPLTNI